MAPKKQSWPKPLPYQKEGVLCIEDYEGRVLLGDEMGLGKTPQVLWALKRNPDWLPALVVCPSNAKYNWPHEALKFVGMRSSVCESRTPPTNNGSEYSFQSPLTIINYDILKDWIDYIKSVGFKSIVFDECHALQNSETKRTKAAKDVIKGIDRVMMLSGTPLTNRPSELYPVLNMLWPKEFKSFWSYGQEYCSPKWTPWGWNYDGASNLRTLHKQLTVLGMIRRRKKDVLKDLPDKIRCVLPMDMSDPGEYKEASTDFLLWLKRTQPHKVRSASRAEKLARVGYLLRLSAKLKMRSVVEWANKFLEETDEKLVIFAVHRKAIDVLRRRIKAKSVVIDGSVPASTRSVYVNQFQKDDKTRLFIGNVKAAGTAITLTAASTTLMAELWWKPGDLIQAEDRTNRIGQKKTTWIHYAIACNTIEDDLCKLIQKKQKVITAVLDGEDAPEDFNIYDELLDILEGRIKL